MTSFTSVWVIIFAKYLSTDFVYSTHHWGYVILAVTLRMCIQYMFHTGLQILLHQATFTRWFNLQVKPQNTFQVIICASSCVVFTDGAPVSSGPLVIQITQILQLSRAGRCKKRAGGEWTEICRKYAKIHHTSVKFIARINYCIHGDMRKTVFILNDKSSMPLRREERKRKHLMSCNLKLTWVWNDQMFHTVSHIRTPNWW